MRDTWQGGHKVDLDAFIGQIQAIDPTEHAHLAATAAERHCC